MRDVIDLDRNRESSAAKVTVRTQPNSTKLSRVVPAGVTSRPPSAAMMPFGLDRAFGHMDAVARSRAFYPFVTARRASKSELISYMCWMIFVIL